MNTLKIAIPDFIAQLIFPFTQPERDLPEILVLQGFVGSPRQLPGFDEGCFAVQDPSSGLVAHWVDPKTDDLILDCCAAPGSKTTHLAARMHNQGQIIALEPVEGRLNRLTENLERLGVGNVKAVLSTAEQYDPGALRFDKILVDAPCSGTGTIRKHPEILIQLVEAHLADYTRRQLAILTASVRWLKSGGMLIYSTCSLDFDENRGVVDQFLAQQPEFELLQDEQRLITEFSDGFYLAKLKRREA